VIRQVESSGKAKKESLAPLREELGALEQKANALRLSAGSGAGPVSSKGGDLGEVIREDRARASALFERAQATRKVIEGEQVAIAKDSLTRLDRRLSRLVRRARLGRIETVLGKKRALEVEIEALSQGLLPQTIVDSLDAARYLGDDEEYWPFDGEDWEDEYVGGEKEK
jgi:hypothetical protein